MPQVPSVSGYDLLFIYEAQRIADLGINLKILHDNVHDHKIYITGSSSLQIRDITKEPLNGTYNSILLAHLHRCIVSFN